MDDKRKAAVLGAVAVSIGLVIYVLGIEAGHPLHKLVDTTRIAGPTGARKRHPVIQAFHHAKKHVLPKNKCKKPCFDVAGRIRQDTRKIHDLPCAPIAAHSSPARFHILGDMSAYIVI